MDRMRLGLFTILMLGIAAVMFQMLDVLKTGDNLTFYVFAYYLFNGSLQYGMLFNSALHAVVMTFIRRSIRRSIWHSPESHRLSHIRW